MRHSWREIVRWTFFIAVVLVVLFIVRQQVAERHAFETSRGTGLAAYNASDRDSSVAWNTIAERGTGLGAVARMGPRARVSNIIGGVVSGVYQVQMATKRTRVSDADKADSPANSDAPKVVRVAKLVLQVKGTSEAVAALKRMVAEFHGQIDHISQQQLDATGNQTAEMTLRVPADQLDAALARFKTVAITVGNETVDVRDVTRQWVDQEARLHNLRAAEQQYLQILRTAKSVQDTLEVTGKLDEVRGEIETTEAERKALAHDIDMSSVEIALTQDRIEQVSGIHWRPWLNAKRAGRDSLAGLADWADAIVAFLLQLPVIALWLATILFVLAVGWRLLRWFFRKFLPDVHLPWKKQAPPQAA